MKKRLLGLMLTASLVITACQSSGSNVSAKKDDSKVAKESSAVSGSAADNSKSSSTGSNASSSSAGSTTASTAKDESKEKFPSFKTTDIDGNEVTEKIFADKDITMVNVWGTFCGPCIDEMPELQKIYSKLPENANLIGLVVDVPQGSDEGVKAAKSITDDAGVKFTNIVLDESLTSFAQRFYGVPSTIFVDKEGNIVGDLVVGARTDAYILNLQEFLKDWKYE